MPAEPLLNPALAERDGTPLSAHAVGDQTKRCAGCQRLLSLTASTTATTETNENSGTTSLCNACREGAARLLRYPVTISVNNNSNVNNGSVAVGEDQQQQQPHFPVRSIRRRTGSLTVPVPVAGDGLQQQQLTQQGQQLPTPVSPTTLTPTRAGELDGELDQPTHRRERGHAPSTATSTVPVHRTEQSQREHAPLLPLRFQHHQHHLQLQQLQQRTYDDELGHDREQSPIYLTPIASPSPTQSHSSSSFAIGTATPSSLPSSISSLSNPHSPTSSQAISERRSRSRYASSRNGNDDERCAYGAQPDPLVDISRLRVRSRGYKCLYPGATFRGWQKSGRNSYDVTVTIIDIDFPSSYACGYLRICGLTEDWPELTTYFDAQIIGPTHGFDTQQSASASSGALFGASGSGASRTSSSSTLATSDDAESWGAQRQDDLVHWGRFPAFQTLQSQGVLREPRLTIPASAMGGGASGPEPGPGAVFMRWKERFLVPDHRVQDLTGASFSGFYYVCVDFEPHRREQPVVPPPTTVAPSNLSYTYTNPGYQTNPSIGQPGSQYPAGLAPSTASSMATTSSPPAVQERKWSGCVRDREEQTATMCGFYYHQNSEPYQQLSLTHVKDRYRSSFEFR